MERTDRDGSVARETTDATARRVEEMHRAAGLPDGRAVEAWTSRWGQHWVQVWLVEASGDAWYYRVSDLDEVPALFAAWDDAPGGGFTEAETDPRIRRYPLVARRPHISAVGGMALAWLTRHPDAFARKVLHEHWRNKRASDGEPRRLAAAGDEMSDVVDVWSVHAGEHEWVYRASSREVQPVLIAEIDRGQAGGGGGGYRVHAQLLEALAGNTQIPAEAWAAYAADWLLFRPELYMETVLRTHTSRRGGEIASSARRVARVEHEGDWIQVWEVLEVGEQARAWFYRWGVLSGNDATQLGSVASGDPAGFRVTGDDALLRRLEGRSEITDEEWGRFARDWLTMGEAAHARAVERAIRDAGNEQENPPNRLARVEHGERWAEVWAGGLDGESWLYRFSDGESGPVLIGHSGHFGDREGLESDEPLLQDVVGTWVSREGWQRYVERWLDHAGAYSSG